MATLNTGSQKFLRLRLIIFVNGLTDFETGFWFCKSLRMQTNERSLKCKCYETKAKLQLKDLP